MSARTEAELDALLFPCTLTPADGWPRGFYVVSVAELMTLVDRVRAHSQRPNGQEAVCWVFQFNGGALSGPYYKEALCRESHDGLEARGEGKTIPLYAEIPPSPSAPDHSALVGECDEFLKNKEREWPNRLLPKYGDKAIDYAEVKWSVGEAKGSGDEPENGHAMCNMNLNSLDRILHYFLLQERKKFVPLIAKLRDALVAASQPAGQHLHNIGERPEHQPQGDSIGDARDRRADSGEGEADDRKQHQQQGDNGRGGHGGGAPVLDATAEIEPEFCERCLMAGPPAPNSSGDKICTSCGAFWRNYFTSP